MSGRNTLLVRLPDHQGFVGSCETDFGRICLPPDRDADLVANGAINELASMMSRIIRCLPYFRDADFAAKLYEMLYLGILIYSTRCTL